MPSPSRFLNGNKIMKQIKGFILAITGLFITITLISLLMPSKVMVSRGVVVNAKADKIYPELIKLRNWKNWQPVFKGDSAHVTFSNIDSTDNAFCEWVSNDKTNRFVVTSHTATTVSFSLVRKGENDVLNTISILPLPDTSTVQIEWKALT